jgi:hypothetical protein
VVKMFEYISEEDPRAAQPMQNPPPARSTS